MKIENMIRTRRKLRKKNNARKERNDRCARQKAIAHLFHIFKNVEENMNMTINRDMRDLKKP